MIREELYKKSIDILSRAYLEGTLEHDNFCACAVGNLIAANCGISYTYDLLGGLTWEDGFFGEGIIWYGDMKNGRGDANRLIRATGYSQAEVYQIEACFENEMNDPDGYEGMMAVVDFLDALHEVRDQKITEESKAKFTRPITV